MITQSMLTTLLLSFIERRSGRATATFTFQMVFSRANRNPICFVILSCARACAMNFGLTDLYSIKMTGLKLQSTLVMSKSNGLYETLRDTRTSTYQICGTEEKK